MVWDDLFATTSSKPRKRQLTAAQKTFLWENNPHKCNICGKRVMKQSDAEFDHTRAFSKGGATNGGNIKITHRFCNRLKGSKPLSQVRKELGITTGTGKKKVAKKAAPKKKPSANPFERLW